MVCLSAKVQASAYLRVTPVNYVLFPFKKLRDVFLQYLYIILEYLLMLSPFLCLWTTHVFGRNDDTLLLAGRLRFRVSCKAA